ncbi:hypothetical protein A2U01_0109326, partial [Trifolium medium]|nr:hypothetical protein [Trifolium medium]
MKFPSGEHDSLQRPLQDMFAMVHYSDPSRTYTFATTRYNSLQRTCIS